MSRIKTGRMTGENQWAEQEPARARAFGLHASYSTGGFVGGELVTGGESDADRARRQTRESKQRRKERAT